MTRRFLAVFLLALTATAQDRKSLPNQAGNAKLSLDATVYTDEKQIKDQLGVELGKGYIVVKMRATPQSGESIRLSSDDFTLISRKNGERSGALSPSGMYGSTVMVVTPTYKDGGIANNGMGMPLPNRNGAPPRVSPGGIGNAPATEGGTADARITKGRSTDPRIAALEEKMFPDVEVKEAVEGYLYFAMDGKLKPGNLGLVYAGQAGRLVIDFK